MHSYIHVYIHVINIKTHSCVSAAKKAVWCISVLFTNTTNPSFSASYISITTPPISMKFTILCPLYTQLYIRTKFEGNQPGSLQDT